MALVDGQVVNVGSTGCGAGAAVAQARLGTSNLAGASANRDSGAETDDGRGGKRIGVEGGRENGVLGAKMTGPMATLEALVAVVPEARQPEMVKALNLLREVQQALGGGGGLGGTTTALLQQGWQQESGSKGNKARVASSSATERAIARVQGWLRRQPWSQRSCACSPQPHVSSEPDSSSNKTC